MYSHIKFSIYKKTVNITMEEKKKEVTQILKNFSSSKRAADLYPMVYDNLHDIAEKLYRRERPGHSLQPTLLVNEAYMNLVDQDQIDWKGRSHFYAVGAQAIRRVFHCVLQNVVRASFHQFL